MDGERAGACRRQGEARPPARLVLLLAVAALAPLGATQAAHHAHEPCADAAAPEPFWRGSRPMENLHFHEGLLYATGQDARLRALAPDGSGTIVAALDSGGGAMASDGSALYVRVGRSVWLFADPLSGAHAVLAEGLAHANGLARDDAGDVYVSGLGNNVIYRLPADAPSTWERWLDVHSPNGLVLDPAAGAMYVAQSYDGRSTILRIQLDDSRNVTQVASLSFGFVQADNVLGIAQDPQVYPPPARAVDPSDPASPLVPKGLDDLTLGPDGMLYAAAWATGEILRVDPATGAACAVASGIPGPSSVRVARGFAPHDGDLFVTQFGNAREAGGVVRVPLALAFPAATEEGAGAPEGPSPRAVPWPSTLALVALAGAAWRRATPRTARPRWSP